MTAAVEVVAAARINLAGVIMTMIAATMAMTDHMMVMTEAMIAMADHAQPTALLIPVTGVLDHTGDHFGFQTVLHL